MDDTNTALSELEKFNIFMDKHGKKNMLTMGAMVYDMEQAALREQLTPGEDVTIGEFDYNDTHIWRLQDEKRAFMLSTPKGLHPDTQSLVAMFAHKIAVKLFHAQEKYGYSDGWKNPDWMDECRKKLREHVEKGDPRDVAAYCAFLDWHQETTATKSQAVSQTVKGHQKLKQFRDY